MYGLLADTFMTAAGFRGLALAQDSARLWGAQVAACQDLAPLTKASMKPDRPPAAVQSTGK